MKKTVTESDFIHAFDSCGRSSNFTYEGRQALFEYLEGLGETGEEEIELDPIAFCCEYSEYETALGAALEKGYEPDTDFDDEDATEMDAFDLAERREQIARDWLEEQTSVIVFDSGVIIADF